MKAVFWGNYKGGVGKTTSVLQIAGRFASKGKRVLLIDLDPQCSLSSICYNNNAVGQLSELKVERTFNYVIELYRQQIEGTPDAKFKVLTDKLKRAVKPLLRELLIGVKDEAFADHLYFIPSSISFENARINELAEVMQQNTLNVIAMKLLLEDIGESFDYVFFDCPPTTNILIQSVFLASDYYIVPTIVDEISAKGVQDYIVEIEKTHMKYCMDPNVGGVLMNKVYHKRPQFIGVFETIYKERRGNAHNIGEIEKLDENITKIMGVQSLLSEPRYEEHRYNHNTDDFSTTNIFKYCIKNRDNRSANGESIPKNTANATLTPSYEVLADALMSMV
ncbi:MAG: ParA family protein [Cellulosilyticaceae bacterium]